MTCPRLACGVLAMCLMVARVAPAAPHDGDAKSEGVASALAIGGTLAGVAAAAAAVHAPDHASPLAFVAGGLLVFGPSFGRWYTGEVWSTGLTLRLTVGAVALVGAAPLLNQMNHDADPGSEYVVFLGLVAAVGAVVTTSVALDIGGTPDAVRAYNRAHQGRMTIGPIALRAGGALRPGLAVTGAF